MGGDDKHLHRAVPDVCVCSRARATRIVNGQEPSPPVATLISICDPGQPAVTGHLLPDRVLKLEFYDTLIPSDPLGPTAEDVEQVLAFATEARSTGGMCLVHCQAGISRSTATAVLLFASWFGPGREEDAAQAVLRLVPHAMPNPLLIALGDAKLGRQGALQAAVDEVFVSLLLF
jgi:predicted protein tyrosine phosphatase